LTDNLLYYIKKNRKMKRTIFLVIILSSVCYAFGQTTQEEYNYCKREYARAVTNGYDLRKDADMILINTDTIDGKELQTMALQRKDKSIACYYLQMKNALKTTRITVPDPRSPRNILSDFHNMFSYLDASDKFCFMVMTNKLLRFQ